VLTGEKEGAMPFSENIKIEAKKLANFRCVVCQGVWVEIHHIQPEGQGGPNALDNAAPLCAGCHHQYGGNPDERASTAS
jgi:5-methylcytosine-specific restriction endonuclease McrA